MANNTATATTSDQQHVCTTGVRRKRKRLCARNRPALTRDANRTRARENEKRFDNNNYLNLLISSKQLQAGIPRRRKHHHSPSSTTTNCSQQQQQLNVHTHHQQPKPSRHSSKLILILFIAAISASSGVDCDQSQVSPSQLQQQQQQARFVRNAADPLNLALDTLDSSASSTYHYESSSSSATFSFLNSPPAELSSSASSANNEPLLVSAANNDARLLRQPQTNSISSPQPDSSSDPNAADGDQSFLSAQQQQPATYDYHANMPVITKRELANAIKQASSNVDQQLDELLLGATATSAIVDDDQTSLASSMFHKAAPSLRDDLELFNQTRQALISEETTRLLAKQFKLNRQQTLRGLPLISLEQTNLGRQCQRESRSFNCIPGQYRSLSGHCNNVQNPDWATAQMPLVRYAPPNYSDNIARPARTSSVDLDTTNQQQQPVLPSARAVSTAIYSAVSGQSPANSGEKQQQVGQPHSHMTTMLSFFGQFIFHDLAFVPQFSLGPATKCCQQQQRHPECFPIEYKRQQEHYCLDYVRSVPAIRNGCNLGHRDQLNLVSSYLDGSAIYGSTEQQMRRLRTFSGGRLRSQRAPTGGGGANQQQQTASLELLPEINLEEYSAAGSNNNSSLDSYWLEAAQQCQQMAQMRQKQRQRQASTGSRGNCFQAGDVRVNENIGLTLMHTIWLREHNHIADRLGQINRHWRDERLFEEARRIVVAELQHITFQEFLPSILGDEVMQRFNLSCLSQGYFQNYEPQLNAGVSNELASAVFPFILSTIPSQLERYSDRLEMLGSTNLVDTFMDASDLFKRNKFAQYLTGMMSQSAMEPALGVIPMMTGGGGGSEAPSSAAFNATSPPKLDAVAMTIQQGRDHGLKSYTYWRRVCQLKPIVRNWSDLAQVMPQQTVDKLRQVYASVDQLDLYLALLESPAPGATIGPTFVCLLARQFYHLKHGDRFWFENDLPGLAFSLKQLDEIRQSSLAKVLCRNSQSTISFIQPSPMLASDPYLNAYQYCTNRAMNELDLSKWRQVVTSAKQELDEELMNELGSLGGGANGGRRSLARGKRLIEENVDLIVHELGRAKSSLDSVARQESAKLKAATKSATRARRHSGDAMSAPPSHYHHHGASTAAGYRYLPRLKRQTLRINNQSIIYELATNEVVRSLLRQGKDREQTKSIQNDIRDFLYSLETIQLDNLLDNSAASQRFSEFISTAGGGWLTEEQRARLAAAGDLILSGDPINEALSAAGSDLLQGQRSSSVSANCQDDDRAFPCDHTSPFRTITGWCNNLNNPKFGQSFTPLDRLLPNAYEDGLSKPRQFSVLVTTTAGDSAQQQQQPIPLPSGRLISTTMHDDTSNLHVRYSLALMQFGQFGVDHDLTRTPFSVAMDGSLLDCSPCDSKRTVHRDCNPIEIPANDPHFHSQKAHELTGTGPKCLHFVRSLNGQTGLGPRQQINALTAYFDASHIYGSDNCEAKSLRAFVGGRLNSSAYPASSASLGYQPREILPVTRANPECVTPSGLCFHAGDQRASEQPGLTAIHTVFMRLHNSIVQQLSAVNRHWTDEKLYQHGRRIVAAISQRIAYGEFAPRLLGLDYMSKFDLMLKQVGYSQDYDDSCSGSILTEFAAAAFRMGHSLIRSAFPLLNRQYKPVGKAFQLRKAFFNSQRILTEPQLIDSILRGIVTTPIETLDNSITDELTNHLFEKPKEPFSGMDLISLNIQRARDHGIPGYNAYRAKCNLTRARQWDDLAGEIPAKLVQRLRGLYASVDDIDLFTGGVSELPVHGGIIGPTFGCIIGMQLSRLKRCDRFWHETSDPFLRFSLAQLAEIRKMSLAKVFCSQSDAIDTIQRQAMDVSDHYLNPRVACSSLPSMDLSVWRENLKSCQVNKIKFELGQTKRVNPCKSCTCTLEGPICRTAKINCLQLMKQANGGGGNGNFLNQIMADKSCLVQCAWALDMPPGFTS